MKLRLAMLAILVTAVAALIIHSLRRDDWMAGARYASKSEPPGATEVFTPLPRDSGVTFQVLRERVLAPYRLRPDRRLRLAVAEIRRLTGAADSAVTAQFTAGQWTVVCGSQEVGKLSELPDFSEMLELLTEWARRQAWTKGWAENSGPERPELVRALDRLDAPAALREADRAWAAGSRDAALFRHAARAYGLLALETPGGGTADVIAARSLATLSFARALGAEDPKRETCLLAEVMGYSAAACQIARQLPARDPLRLYVTQEDAALERVATALVESQRAPASSGTATKAARSMKLRGGKATPVVARKGPAPKTRSSPSTAGGPRAVRLDAPFLHLLRLASRGEYESWLDFLKHFDQPGVPRALVLGTGLRIQSGEPSRLVAENLFQASGVQQSVRQKSGVRPRVAAGSNSNLAQRVQFIEAALDERPHPRGGVLFAAEIARAQERALLDAALDKVAQHSLESLGPAEMSRWFAPSRRSRAGKRAAALQRWYAHLAQARTGRPDIAALRADVDSAAPGPAEALRSYEALHPYLSSDDAALRAAARGLVRRMDSRPDHRIELATIAERDLLALSLAERLEDATAAVQGASDASPTATRPSQPDSTLGPTLARKVAAHPNTWEAAGRYATWLEKHGKYAAGRHVIERWMARSPADTAWTDVNLEARTQLARLHQLEGHPKQALRVLGDLHRSGNFAAMERTALILQDMGQPHQALAIAWAAHRNHPRVAAGLPLLAELFWRQGRYGEAAKVLHDGGLELSGAAWTREVAPRFVAFFRTRKREGLEAAEALTRAGFNERATIGTIPEALGAEGLHPFAFELQSRLRLTGVQQVESSLLAYGYVVRAKGEAAALRWIQGRVPEKDRELLGILAFQEHHPELLWSMPAARMDGEHGDYQWLLRAAACMAAGSSHPRYAETVNHVDRGTGSYHAEIAKYLLGLREESEILALVQDLRQRSEACYFIGLKTEERGRPRDAADWYLMSVESGELNNIESRWAMQRLRLWAREGRPPDRVAPSQPPPA
jgi:tetratricopeptide (TPR) repeat protein